MTLSTKSTALIAAVKAHRAASGLVATDGTHCATIADRAYHDARHNLGRDDLAARHDELAALRSAARKGA